ncbi:MAG: sensor domain-containing diguanylate cyclase [Firmicutes bacterium]|nr:sensor domain-containing diguanylate cyclase [Bacillota bacterium]
MKPTIPSYDSLFDVRVSKRQRFLAYGFMAFLLVLSVVLIPVFTQSAPKLQAFLPSVLSMIMLSEWVTSFLLFGQFVVSRRVSFAILGATYLFSGLIVLPHLLFFPGVFPKVAWFPVPQETATWLWVFWHGGFPLGICIYALAELKWSPIAKVQRVTQVVVVAAGVAVALVIVSVTVSLYGTKNLPEIIQQGNYHLLITSGVGLCVLFISVMAVILVFYHLKKARSVMHLALQMTAVASFMDVAITLVSGQRYMVGWYAARMVSLLTGAMVLLFLLREVAGLYATAVGQQARLNQLAYHDSLTGMFNRRYFTNTLNQYVSIDHVFGAVCMLDIDGFKQVNDRYGHDAGDHLLTQVAHRIQAVVREGDVVARLGGDEFILLLKSGAQVDDVEAIAKRIVNVMQLPIPLPDAEVKVTVSMGISVLPVDGRDAAELIRKSDFALYEAKGRGKNQYQFYGMSVAS